MISEWRGHHYDTCDAYVLGNHRLWSGDTGPESGLASPPPLPRAHGWCRAVWGHSGRSGLSYPAPGHGGGGGVQGWGKFYLGEGGLGALQIWGGGLRKGAPRATSLLAQDKCPNLASNEFKVLRSVLLLRGIGAPGLHFKFGKGHAAIN